MTLEIRLTKWRDPVAHHQNLYGDTPGSEDNFV